jgi:hypothetical protein
MWLQAPAFFGALPQLHRMALHAASLRSVWPFCPGLNDMASAPPPSTPFTYLSKRSDLNPTASSTPASYKSSLDLDCGEQGLETTSKHLGNVPRCCASPHLLT